MEEPEDGLLDRGRQEQLDERPVLRNGAGEEADQAEGATRITLRGVDHPRYLVRLAELELIERERRMVERCIREARFPTVKSLDSFDFTAIPSLNKTLVLELARGEYMARRENAIAVTAQNSVG